MVDIHRAYRGWLAKRLGWLLPGVALSGVIVGRILLDPVLPIAIRIPGLAVAGGVLVLLASLAGRCWCVVRWRAAGDVRRSRILRGELRPYRAFSIVGLGTLLSLSAIPLVFERPPVSPVSLPDRPPTTPRAAPAPSVAAAPPLQEPPPVPAAPAPEPEPAAKSDPQVLPEVVRIPKLDFFDEPGFVRPLPAGPALPSQEKEQGGRERDEFPHRPGIDELRYPARVDAAGLDRGGLPDERDLETWPPPEIRFDVTILPETNNKWYGAIFDISCDLPFGRQESFRLSYFATLVSRERGGQEVELEAELAWQRMTLEYVRRIAGYTRHATFDLALRFGATLDLIAEHETNLALDATPRVSPWIGFETAMWELSGLGVVAQGGYSIATRITDASASVIDLRVVIRYDFSESFSFHAGYRIVSVRLHDHGFANGPVREELVQSFSGPVVGFALRF